MATSPATHNGIRIVTILGTTRPGNFTGMALALVEDELRRAGAEVDAVDPAALELPFPGRGDSADAAALRARVEAATGLVLATPEYHGSFSSMLKLVIENLGFPSVLAGKPLALVGVAAGRIGAIKSLEQLRAVCSHVGAIVLPSAISIAQVRQVFDPDGSCREPRVEKLLRSQARNLLDYLRRHVCPRLTLEALARGEIDVEALALDGDGR
ncbi:MAG: NADPH-dependent oxidoreductase [Acidobacteria bacterium]|nr:MAG: NADPH-dependent oxidoreductase [Acidobacteriota bacterium]